jgi:hypothetical protein
VEADKFAFMERAIQPARPGALQLSLLCARNLVLGSFQDNSLCGIANSIDHKSEYIWWQCLKYRLRPVVAQVRVSISEYLYKL